MQLSNITDTFINAKITIRSLKKILENKNSSLTLDQYVILEVVAKYSDIIQCEIVSVSGIDRSTASDVIRRLASKGLVKVKTSLNDSRANTIKLTAKGRKQLEDLGLVL